MNHKQRLELRRFIKELDKIKGRHTELVSVYIPKDYDLNKVINHLQQEQGTASNIKDAKTRKNVIDSLERAVRHLKLFNKTPENGLAVFAGNASEVENKVDIKVWSIEPPGPLNFRLYRCDQNFVLDPLREMIEVKETYGLIVLDKREANLGLLKGTVITSLVNLHSMVPGKTRAGGQCLMADTFVELDDGQFIAIDELEEGDMVKSFDFKKREFISSKVNKKWSVNKNKIYLIKAKEEIQCSEDHRIFLEDGNVKFAKEIEKGDRLIGENGKSLIVSSVKIQEKEVEMIDISVEKDNFLANGILVHNSAQRFERLREGAAKEFFNKIGEAANKQFLEMKTELKGILIGGPGHTKGEFIDGHYLNNELKEKIIATEDLSYTGEFGLQELVDKAKDVLAKEEIIEEKQIMQKFFELLAREPKKVSYGKKQVEEVLKMGAVETLLLSESLEDNEIEDFEKMADEFSSEVRIISIDSREGIQLRDMGGVAAILRYEV